MLRSVGKAMTATNLTAMPAATGRPGTKTGRENLPTLILRFMQYVVALETEAAIEAVTRDDLVLSDSLARPER